MARPAPFCQTLRKEHFGICSTLEISTESYFEDGEAEHPGFELCFALKDSIHYRRFRDKSHALRPGEVMVFNSRERHTEECSKSPTVPLLRTVIIPASFIDRLVEECGIRCDELVFDGFLYSPSARVWERIHQLFDFAETPMASNVAYECLVSEIALDLVTSVRHSESERISALSRSGHFPQPFVKAKEVIREGLFSESIDLGQIAKEVGLSKFHFVRDFKKNTGFSPVQYLNVLRVDYAKRQLRSRRARIIDVAADLGYSDLSTFNKAFKKQTGLSPSRYQQQFFPS